MAVPEPRAKNLADLYALAPLDWADVARTLETNLDQEPGTGGPDHHTFWLSTVDADGRPHMTAVGAFWADGRYYFSGSPRSRKIRNVERDSRCAFGLAIHGYDVALEGRAARVTDEARLHQLAELFAEGGWAPSVADGGFTHDFSAPAPGRPRGTSTSSPRRTCTPSRPRNPAAPPVGRSDRPFRDRSWSGPVGQPAEILDRSPAVGWWRREGAWIEAAIE
jgi:hypothetical protein